MANRTLKSVIGVQPDEIYDDITQNIISFELKPGQIISENSLAEKYNTSRTTIRSILQRLERDTLVQIIPQKGSFVTYLSYDYIKSVMYIRYQVEKDVMLRLQKCYGPDIEETLLQVIRAYDVGGEQDHNNYFVQDARFHRIIYEAVEEGKVWELVESLDARCRRYKMLLINKFDNYAAGFGRTHMGLLDVLRDGTAQDLEEDLHRHIFGYVYELKEKLENEDEWQTYF